MDLFNEDTVSIWWRNLPLRVPHKFKGQISIFNSMFLSPLPQGACKAWKLQREGSQRRTQTAVSLISLMHSLWEFSAAIYNTIKNSASARMHQTQRCREIIESAGISPAVGMKWSFVGRVAGDVNVAAHATKFKGWFFWEEYNHILEMRADG